MKKIFYLFFLICFNSIYSQDLKIENYLVKEDTLLVFNKDSLYKISLNDLKIKKRSKIKIPNNFNYHDHTPYLINDLIYFYKTSGGILFRFDNDSLFRIDNSYDHRLHHKSLNFVHNNTLNILGGYGFFERRSSMVFYDWINNEWIVNRMNFEEFQNGLSDIKFHYILNNDLFIHGFDFTNSENPSITNTANLIYQFDLIKHSVNRKGSLNPIFNKKPKNYFQLNEKLFLLFDFLLIVIDLNLEKFNKIDITFEADKIVHVDENKITFLNKKSEDTYKLFQNDVKSIMPLEFPFSIKKNNWTIHLVLISLFFVFLIFLIIKKLGNKKFHIKNSKFYFNRREIKFLTKMEYLIIEYLFINGSTSNIEILELLNNVELDIGHQNRIKKELIENLNKKLKIFVEDDLIIKSSSKTDRRIKVYSLNEQIIY